MHFLMKRLSAVVLCASILFGCVPVSADTSLSEAQSKAAEAKKELEEAKEELSEAQQELTDVLADIAEIEVKIETKEDEIQENENALSDAKEQEEYQRSLMESRIQYMYENNGSSMLEVILESGSLGELLNKVEYMTTVYNEDRQLVEEYGQIVSDIEEIEKALEEEYESLKEQNDAYEERQEELEALTKELKNEVSDYEEEYEEALSLVSKYKSALSSSASSSNTSSSETSSSASVSTSSIVAYARQFIGYPYSYGGNSLTGGIDCSHFVYQVLKNTGHYSGSYRTSSGWRSAGYAVSKSEAQAGDILCYSGHVSIYSGNGMQIHARNRKSGICETSVSWGSVIAVRRVS